MVLLHRLRAAATEDTSSVAIIILYCPNVLSLRGSHHLRLHLTRVAFEECLASERAGKYNHADDWKSDVNKHYSRLAVGGPTAYYILNKCWKTEKVR